MILENKHFDVQKLQGADVLIINTNHTGHALVRKACQQAASQGTSCATPADTTSMPLPQTYSTP